MIDGSLNLPRPSDGDAALTVTLDWLRGPGWTDKSGALALQPLDESGTPNTLAEHLSAAGLANWRDAIITAARPGRPLLLDPHLAWLMGEVALEVAVGTDQPGLFDVVEEFQMLSGISDATLASAVCSRIADVANGHPLLARLRSRLQTLWNSPFNERLRIYAEATATQSLTSRSLWPRYDGTPVSDGWAHRVAATLWPDRYMEMLASFPAPFQHGFSDPLSPLDLDLVASLVRASPDVFSCDGALLGPVLVFVLLEAIEAQFATINVHEMAAAEVGLGNVLDSVFSRRDGDWIGRAWLQQIIWRDTPRRAGRAHADVSAQRTLRSMLLVQLSGRIAPLGEAVFDWVRKEEALWRGDRVLSEASILEAHHDATAAAEILAGAVRQGLISATGRASGLISSSPEATIVARVLSHLPDQKQWFETLWRDTYELREHLSYFAHSGLDNPAYPVLTWSLIALNSSQAMRVDAAGYWSAIAAAVFETQRIDPNAGLFNGPMPPITRVTVQLGAALVNLGILPVGDFANFLADQLEPSAEHARLWQIARAEASDNVTVAAGRIVGAALLRQALEAGLAQNLPTQDTVLTRSARDDLADFARRL
jgi:hypothetical protein